MRRTVYIETTVPSFYAETRTEPAMIARRESTRLWWTEEAPRYDLHVSALVLSELADGDYPGKAEALALVGELPVLDIVPEIEDIAAVYVRKQLMSSRDTRDAFHLAIASHYAVNFLLTWNCRHLANVNKTEHLREINSELGLYVPKLATPDMLIREDIENGA
jgi:predicted nucleic acid-binding protein